MITRLIITLTIFTFFTSSYSLAASSQEKRVLDAADVIDQILRIPEQSVPPALLSRAYAIAVFPNVLKIGALLGIRRGKGIIVIRNEDNSWSNPAFITLTGGSLGLQVGAQSTDSILVFKTRKGIDGISNGKLTLGADASVAAGPIGRHTAAATDLRFNAEIYSYSRSRGLFIGVSLEGATLTMDRRSNANFYSSTSITPDQIFNATGNAAPMSANTFIQKLTAQTHQLPIQPGMENNANSNDSSDTQTYRLSDAFAPQYKKDELILEYN
ncbi:MAG: lipid-binding SYLF domain-containing protein [Woeseiaceae bacterium]|jgi:lipid-binding SYLF domain-containing protein|nr:lipid-binding SYLF domain-containing protein [Woeseiaceae bacterium]|tara:strand:- start:2997 stop:3806 length:810 start_codon:yes stop_codon:yes gene_type:complete